ncbi:24236_t:CDS:10 [Cetraspora pellucida]|uniref:24236_t:CDS:1 n=1 Tax=Cetraspora pellucida TaxID=1433469 RepID=A0A9N9DTE5_9GLOM|nr:24236_t:CDS:10 [Cetraspora pellucida]
MSFTALARLKKRRLLVRWLFTFPSEQYSKHTYISENALLPGQVNTYYGWQQVFDATAYRDRIKSMSNSSNIEKINYIEGELRRAGLKTATQNFTAISSGKVISGINVFGVLSSPRTDGTEALVLSAPWRSKDGVTTNINGIAAALSLGKFFKSTDYTYWSKDIIILITDGGEVGVQAWLESYHDHKQSGIEASPLFLRSGAIQAAINLDFPGTSNYKALGLFFEGLNGQLPNLDLINTVVRVCRMSSNIPIMLRDSGRCYTHYDSGDYQSSFYNLITFMKYQALGHPTGSHGLFFRYKIDAITLYGQVDASIGNSYGFFEIGSLFPFLFVVYALELWGTTSDDETDLIPNSNHVQSSSPLNNETNVQSSSPLNNETNVQSSSPLNNETNVQSSSPLNNETNASTPLAYLRRPREILMPVAALVISHFAGFIIFFVVKNHFKFSQISSIFGIDGYLFTLAITTNISIIATLSPSPDWVILKSFILAFTAMIISCLSVLNFSLAVFISIIVVIPFSLFQPSTYEMIRYLELIVLVLISPPGILIISKINLEEFLRWTIMEYELLGSYFLPFICCLYWPIILVYVVIIFSPIK